MAFCLCNAGSCATLTVADVCTLAFLGVCNDYVALLCYPAAVFPVLPPLTDDMCGVLVPCDFTAAAVDQLAASTVSVLVALCLRVCALVQSSCVCVTDTRKADAHLLAD